MNVFRVIVSVVFILLSASISKAQNPNAEIGKVELVQEKNVKELIDKHIEINSKAPIKGYRIKIHFGSDKNKAKEVKAKFIAKFPDIAAYEKYDQPNFNIRVGDFRTKLEAYKVLKEIQVEFPSSFLVQDEIEMPKLIGAEIK
ncbi:MAG: SPOR domain-containing protein [Bacteroidetes bacterium]|nr:SPOR domain-containing protein [Bacteroidota bacterium]